MYQVSSDFLTAIKQPSRTVKSSIGVGDTTLTNIVTNGDFSNGSTGWSLSGGATLDSVNNKIGSSNGIKLLSADGTTVSSITQSVSLTAGRKYYASVWGKTSGNVTAQGQFDIIGQNPEMDYSNLTSTVMPTVNQWYYLSNIVTANTTGNSSIRCYSYSTVALYVDGVILIDLTSMYGAGNEPSKAYMDEMIAKIGWFNGSKNVPSRFVDDRILTNGITNGDFSNGTTGWNMAYGTGTVTNNIFTLTGNGSGGSPCIYQSSQNLPYVDGHKIYVYGYYRANSSLCKSFHMEVRGSSNAGNNMSTSSVTNTSAGTYYKVSGIVTPTGGSGYYNVMVRCDYSLATDSNGVTMDFKNVLAIDLTALYGAGNEPTQAYMDNIINTYGWFNTLPLLLSQSGERTIISNFTIESSFGNKDIPTIGGTVSNKLSLTLINDSRMPSTLIGTPIKPYVAIDIGGGVYEWVEQGKFYSDYADVTKNKLTTSLDAFDKMATHDSCEYSTNLVLPLTVSDVINDLANTPDYDITFASQPNLPNPSLTSVPHGTVRQVLSQLASLMTTNAVINEHGDVKFIFLTSSGFTMDKTNYIDFKLEPDSTVKVSQLQIKDGDKITAVGDSTGFALQLENAQIPDSSTLTTVFNRAFPLTFYAYTMKAQGMPHLQIGDTVSFTYVKIDGSTSTITIPILKHKFIFSGGMISEFKASAPKDDTTTLTVTGGSTVEHSVNQAYAELTDAIHDATRLITGNQGGYITTVLSDDGKPQELVISNTVDFNTAKNVWRWNASGLGFSNSGYSGNYGLALTSDGQINASYITIGGMSAQRITAGRLQDKNGLSWLDLDTGQFSFGSGKLAWDGSKFTIKYNGTDLDSALNNKANQSDLQPYVDNITIGTNGITVGKTGNPFAVNITNMAVEFLDYGTGSGAYTPSSNTIAYITGKKMYITDLQTTNSIQVGNHQVYKYDANITLIKYVG